MKVIFLDKCVGTHDELTSIEDLENLLWVYLLEEWPGFARRLADVLAARVAP
jgi:hypothetical protein